MNWGMKNRLSRIINPESGKALMLAVDHGYFLGPTSGLEDLGKTVKPLLPFTDSLMITRGALRNCVEPAMNVANPRVGDAERDRGMDYID